AHLALQAAHRLPGARQHELQRARRAHRVHAAGRLPLLHGVRAGYTGRGQLLPREKGARPCADGRLQEPLRARLTMRARYWIALAALAGILALWHRDWTLPTSETHAITAVSITQEQGEAFIAPIPAIDLVAARAVLRECQVFKVSPLGSLGAWLAD